jgi:hypothetical protein
VPNGAKSPAQRQAAAVALAAGETIAEAAAGAHMGERTLLRWLHEDASFRAQVEEIRNRLLEQATGRLANTATAATVRLKRLVRSKSESVALGACRCVLDHVVRLRDGAFLAAEVAELKAWRKQLEGGRDGHTP